MDPRLEKASHVGDLDTLHWLLEQDMLLLDRLTTTLTDNPLHIAALLGHADFAREILRRKPGLARDLNTHGLSPMHLASASGHLPVVRQLLKEGGSELCLVRDKDGLMPIHSAALKGRVHVLAELMEACPESAREQTCSGDTVLHLALKSHCFEAVKFLVERIDSEEALNSKDEKGNTILHLAVAMRQLQTTKFLLTRPRIDVNGVNAKGLTALDVLLELPREHGDLALGEMIRASGGKTAGVGETLQPAQTSSITVTDPPLTRPQNRSSWMRHLRQAGLWFGRPSASRTTAQRRRVKAHPDNEDSNLKGTVMVVATLIATITFQSGLNPPGGFDSKTGKAVLGDQLGSFLIADMIGLFASLSVILLFICVVPRRPQKQQLTRALLWVMWVAVYSTALAFSAAANKIFPQTLAVSILVQGWYMILIITILWVNLRFAFHLLGKNGWWKKNKTHDSVPPRMGAALVMKRILVLVVILAPIPIVSALLTFYVPYVNNSPTWDTIISLVEFLTISAPVLWAYLRFAIYQLRKVGWWENAPVNGESNAPPIGAALVIKRILILVMIGGAPLVIRSTVIYIYYIYIKLSNLTRVGIFFRLCYLPFGIPVIWVCHRFIIHKLGMVGWWKELWDGESNAQQMNVARAITRTVVIMVFVLAIVAVGFPYDYLAGVIFHRVKGSFW